MDQLTKEVLACQSNRGKISSVTKKVALVVYRYPRHNTYWSEDLCSDFYLSYHHKIPRIILRFKYMGVPFLSYLKQSLFWHVRTFASWKNRQLNWEEALLRVSALEREKDGDATELASCKRVTVPFFSDRKKSPLRSSTKKRIIYLLLINALFLDEEKIRRGAALAEVSFEWLDEKVALLRRMCENRLLALRGLEERYNKKYMTLLVQQRVIDEARSLGKSTEKELMRLERVQSHLLRLRPRCRKARADLLVPHRLVAQALKVPKGSIDSGLFYLKAALTSDR